MLVGCASTEGTQEFLEGHQISKKTELGDTGLFISKIGFGTYRTHVQNQEHIDALKLAIKNGINVIDTSTNYMDGMAELSIAEVLKSLEDEGIFRKHIVVISKAGYIQGRLLKAMKEKGENLPELVKYSENCWHSIHPEFLKAQIEQSLDRLDFIKHDFFLLHNPEYYFLDMIQKGEVDTDKIRKEFYDRIYRAFIQLEESVKEDKIQYYGLSSNSLAIDPNYRDFIDMDKMIQCAIDASRAVNGHDSHHFKMLQFPLNIVEQEAMIYANQNGRTITDIASEHKIAVVTNRPINAMSDENVFRLAEYPCDSEKNYIPEIQKQLLALEKAEKYLENIMIDDEFVLNDEVKTMLMISSVIDRNLDHLHNLEESHYLESQVMHVFTVDLIKHVFSRATPKNIENFRAFFKLYIEILNKTFSLLNEHMNQTTNSKNKKFIEANSTKYKLAEFALNVIASDEQIDCVLNGMRKEAYVYEAIRIINFQYLENNRKLMAQYLSKVIDV